MPHFPGKDDLAENHRIRPCEAVGHVPFPNRRWIHASTRPLRIGQKFEIIDRHCVSLVPPTTRIGAVGLPRSPCAARHFRQKTPHSSVVFSRRRKVAAAGRTVFAGCNIRPEKNSCLKVRWIGGRMGEPPPRQTRSHSGARAWRPNRRKSSWRHVHDDAALVDLRHGSPDNRARANTSPSEVSPALPRRPRCRGLSNREEADAFRQGRARFRGRFIGLSKPEIASPNGAGRAAFDGSANSRQFPCPFNRQCRTTSSGGQTLFGRQTSRHRRPCW